MSAFLRDVKLGARVLMRSRAYTAIAVATMALGIAANTAIFSVVHAVLLRPLPYSHPGELVFLSVDSRDPSAGTYESNFATLAGSRSLRAVARLYRDTGISRVTITGPGEPETVQAAFVSGNLFSVLGVRPQLGRALTPADEANREHVVVLSAALWMRRFGGTSDVVGKTLDVDGVRSVIVGVMPTTFQFPAGHIQFWTPITTNRAWGDPAVAVRNDLYNRSFYTRWLIVGRLRPEVTPATAQAEMKALSASMSRADPVIGDDFSLHVIPVRVDVALDTRLTLVLLLGAVGAVLLIGCVNVANLTLARGTTRQREFAIRTAMGASRVALLRHVLGETTALALLAGASGLLLAAWAIPVIVRFAPPGIPRIGDASLDPVILSFAATVSLASALLVGIVPAWRMSNTNPIDALQARGAGSGEGRGVTRARNVLVVAEFGLATVLLAAAGLLIRSMLAVNAVDPGFQPDSVLTMRVALPPTAPASRRLALYDDVLGRVREVPGVVTAGGIDALFELGAVSDLGLRAIDGRILNERAQDWTALTWRTVSGDYFRTMGAQVRGRSFSPEDSPDSPLVAVIDESLARRYWPGLDPIGQRFKGQDRRRQNDEWLEVIGVVNDMRRHGLERQATPHVYLSYSQSANATPDIVVRTAGSAAPLRGAVRQAVRSADRIAVLSDVTTLRDRLDQQLAPRRFRTWLLTVFSIVALLLAAIGIYSVMYYTVAQRRQEIGIRIALGARPADVVRMVVGHGLLLAVMGLTLGLAGAFGIAKVMASLLFGVSPFDVPAFTAAATLLLASACLASWVPARRASSINPVRALNAE